MRLPDQHLVSTLRISHVVSTTTGGFPVCRTTNDLLYRGTLRDSEKSRWYRPTNVSYLTSSFLKAVLCSFLLFLDPYHYGTFQGNSLSKIYRAGDNGSSSGVTPATKAAAVVEAKKFPYSANSHEEPSKRIMIC